MSWRLIAWPLLRRWASQIAQSIIRRHVVRTDAAEARASALARGLVIYGCHLPTCALSFHVTGVLVTPRWGPGDYAAGCRCGLAQLVEPHLGPEEPR